MSTSRNPSNSSTSSDGEYDRQTFGVKDSDEVKWHKDPVQEPEPPAKEPEPVITLPVSQEDWVALIQRYKDATIEFNRWREAAFVGYLTDAEIPDIKTGFIKLLTRTTEMDAIITFQDGLINQLQKSLNKYIENEKQQPDIRKSQVPAQ